MIEPFTAPDDGGLPPASGRSVVGTTTFAARVSTEAELVARALSWCAEAFGVESARLVRPLDATRWTVLTWRRDGLLAYAADDAEVAMAWRVGLTRQPLVVNRPRVSRGNGGQVRPIATKTYVGLPVVCQDQLVGVAELAGDIAVDIESALARALPRLTLVAQRIVHDPALRPPPAITLDTRCALDSGAAFGADIVISAPQLRFLAAIRGEPTVAEIAASAGLEPDAALEIAADVAGRGLARMVG